MSPAGQDSVKADESKMKPEVQTKPEPQSKAPEKPAQVDADSKYEVKDSIEHWWSSRFRNHMIAIDPALGVGDYIRFDGYSLQLDLSEERGKKVSEALHACGQEGRDLFVVGKSYDGNEFGKSTNFMRKLREIANDENGDGPERIRALFTRKELVRAGLTATTEDIDALITLALRTKSIQGETLK